MLTDVLAEAEPAGFRAALLGETLLLAARRRRVRHIGHASGALAILCVLGTLVWQFMPPGHGILAAKSTDCAIVRTETLPPSSIIHTQPFAADHTVVSVASVDIVHTTPNSGKFHKINDDELLALVVRPAALVRVGPQSAKLIFLNPEDQKDFPLN
ncbi:MAG TPA: hypothetical protein VMU17_07935 [Elusimicrobiota bacterium]|nr:hypothetical protein [Elusimicrobiota bacterium]